MAVAKKGAAVGGDEVVAAAAGLRAATAVAAAAYEVLAEVALAAVAHAEGAVDEGLELEAGGLADGAHLVERGLAGKDDATEAYRLHELDAFHSGVVTLGAGVKLDGRQVALEEAEVLQDEGVDTGVVELAYHGDCGLQFVVEKQRVDSGVDAGAVEVGIAHQGVDVGKTVGGGGTGAVGRGPDIKRVGAVVDSLAPEVEVLRR